MEKLRKYSAWLFWSWLLTIWILSSLPSANLPDYQIFSLDKVLHFGVYFVLGTFFSFYLLRRKAQPRKCLLWFGVLILSALAEEYHQAYIPGRSVSVYDFLANASGLIVAVIVWYRKR